MKILRDYCKKEGEFDAQCFLCHLENYYNVIKKSDFNWLKYIDGEFLASCKEY